MRFLIALSFWLAAALPVHAANPIAVLPYEIDYGGWLTVKATVNGRGPYDFVIDTGSTLTLAFQNLADQQPFAATGMPPLRVLGITGAGQLDTFVIGAVGLGPAMLDDHIGVILPDWDPPRRTPHGIIGLDFLRRYAIYFDTRARTMTLFPHGGLPEESKQRLSRLQLSPNNFGATSGALYTAQARINRKRLTFIIDLGSASTLINYRAAESFYANRIVASDLRRGFTTGSRLSDVFGDRKRARTARVPRITLGRVSWRDHGVWVYNAPIFDEIAVQNLPYGLAGIDLFADRDFALDFSENEMYIAKRSRR